MGLVWAIVKCMEKKVFIFIDIFIAFIYAYIKQVHIQLYATDFFRPTVNKKEV